MRLHRSLVIRPYCRKLQFEQLECKAYPGALLWGFGAAGPAHDFGLPAAGGQFLANRGLLSEADAGPSGKRVGYESDELSKQTTRPSSNYDAALEELASRDAVALGARVRATSRSDLLSSPNRRESHAEAQRHRENDAALGSVLAGGVRSSDLLDNSTDDRHGEIEPPILKDPSAPVAAPGARSGGGGGGRNASAGSAGGSGRSQDHTGGYEAGDANASAQAATSTAASGLALVDADGNSLDIPLDSDTLVVGAATWCGACAQFKQQLAAPEMVDTLDGLRIVFAFGDEGGTGPGGVQDPMFLADLPGELAFLGDGSVRPDSFPSAYNAATGQFDQHPADAIEAWLARTADPPTEPDVGEATIAAAADCGCGSESGDEIASGSSILLPGDYNNNFVVDAADYVVWRKSYGLTGVQAADGNEDLVVNDLDYNVFKEGFGEKQLPGAFSITTPMVFRDGDSFSITWEASVGATSYELVMSDLPDLSANFLTETLTTTSRTFTDFGEATVHIGVTAMNAAGATLASNQGTVITLDIPSTPQVIFVSSGVYSVDEVNEVPPLVGTFGSPEAADFHMTDLANQAGLLREPWDGQTIYYNAMLTVIGFDLTVLSSVGNNGFVNVNGDIIATDRDSLYSGAHTAPILTQNGQTLTGTVPVWTGSDPTGEWSGFACDDWTSPFATAGTVGNLNGSDSAWLSNTTRACHLAARLYGIGVGSPTLYEGDAPGVANPIVDQNLTVETPLNVDLFDAFEIPGKPDDPYLQLYARQSSGLPLPTWLTLDAETGLLSGTPSAAHVGTISIEVTAFHRFGDIGVTDQFELTVTA